MRFPTSHCLAGLLMVHATSFGAVALAQEAKPALYSCTFSKEGWKAADWRLVARPDWGRVGSWVQKEDRIENAVPADAEPEEMLSKRAKETYTSMVYGKKLTGDVTITSKMAFAHRMAPSIVITAKLGTDPKGQTYHGEHFEIVLFDQGVNVWHHIYRDGKASWTKAAFARFPLKKDTPYELKVVKKGKVLTVTVGEFSFGYHDESLPDEFYAGLTGSEGINRFYDFAVHK